MFSKSEYGLKFVLLVAVIALLLFELFRIKCSIFCTSQEMENSKKGMPQPEDGQKKLGRKETWSV